MDMRNRFLRPFLLCMVASLSVSIYSCKKVASDDLKDTVPYYQSYTVNYDKTNSQTSASATFRVRDVNGTKVDLNNGASVTANGTNPNGLQLVPSTYNWDLSGLVDVNFVLTKNSGTKITNTVAKTDIGDIAFPTNMPSIVSKAAGFTFSWAGDALASGETILVTVQGDPASSGLTALITKTVTSGQVTISSSDLTNFAPGTIFITMERHKTLTLDMKDDTSGGDISTTIKIKKDLALNQ